MKLSLEYVAGFIDGEGCLTYTLCRTTVMPRLLVVNTNLDILLKLKNQFGGNISQLSRTKNNWKIGYQWALVGQKSINLIKEIFPFLNIKREQAKLFIEFEKLRPGMGKKWNNENKNYFINTIKYLNKKGIDNAIEEGK